MNCPDQAPAPFACPTFEDSLAATIAIAPRGLAWPVNDGGGTVARFLAWLDGLGGRIPAAEEWPAGYVQAGWFAALAWVRNYIEQRFCDLRLEFWCATESETRDLWLAEYGLPDPCDAFPDLCTKVAALPGARCADYVAVADRLGWEIDCIDVSQSCGAVGDCAVADCAVAADAPPPCQIEILVDIAKSPAFAGRYATMPYADAIQADLPLACFPDIGPLQCVLERIVHAELQITYTVIPPPVYIMADDDTHIADEFGTLLIA
jgi:hypothetical protein